MPQRQSTSLQWRQNDHDSVSNHQPHDRLLNCLFGRRSKKTSKLRVTGLCVVNSPGTGEFPAQMASNAENVSIWWRHHVVIRAQVSPCSRKISRSLRVTGSDLGFSSKPYSLTVSKKIPGCFRVLLCLFWFGTNRVYPCLLGLPVLAQQWAIITIAPMPVKGVSKWRTRIHQTAIKTQTIPNQIVYIVHGLHCTTLSTHLRCQMFAIADTSTRQTAPTRLSVQSSRCK